MVGQCRTGQLRSVLVNYVLADTAVLAYVSSRVFHATRVAVSHYTETVWPTELKIFTCGLFPWPL